jgi:hypothetical protein
MGNREDVIEEEDKILMLRIHFHFCYKWQNLILYPIRLISHWLCVAVILQQNVQDQKRKKDDEKLVTMTWMV